MQETRLKEAPQLWPSAIRMAATSAIFVFHFLGLLGQYQYQLDFYAVIAFSFLSGYLSRGTRRDRILWLKKRYFNVMVPYWIVIIPVLFATILFGYKQVTWVKVLAALAGGNMFVTDPVYVIGWYITFVLLLYFYTFIESLFQSRYHIILMVLGFVIFSVVLHKPYYFLAFIFGLRMPRNRDKPSTTRSPSFSRISRLLFSIQEYCYPFFLIHGNILLFFVRKTNTSPKWILTISFLSTCAFAVVLHSVSRLVQERASKQRLRRSAQPLAAP